MTCMPYDYVCSSTVPALLGVGVGFLCITWINFARLISIERQHIRNVKIQVLSLRIALVIPFLSFNYLMKYVWPIALPIFTAGEDFVEGYCLYCFFRMLVEISACSPGGQQALADALAPTAPTLQSYTFLSRAVLGLLCVRPFLDLVAGVTETEMDVRGERGRLYDLYTIFSVLQALSLALGAVGLLRSYLKFAPHCGDWPVLRKLLFVKFVVIAYTMENLIIVFYTRNGVGVDAKLLIYRYYAFACMGETCVASFFLPWVFVTKTRQPPSPPPPPAVDAPQVADDASSGGGDQKLPPEPPHAAVTTDFSLTAELFSLRTYYAFGPPPVASTNNVMIEETQTPL